MQELALENQDLREAVKIMSSDPAQLYEENRAMKETFLDHQARSMEDNLVILGIPEEAGEDPMVLNLNFV